MPKYGGILKTRISADPYDYDSSLSGKAIGGGNINDGFAYEGLLQFKHGPGVGYSEIIIEPLLAERWEVSPDASTYTFHLRKGIKWADQPPVNGREFTSADVKFSFEYTGRQGQFKQLRKDKKIAKGQYEWMFSGLDKIETPDPYTVVVSFKEPFAPFINYVAAGQNHMFAHEIFDQDGNFSDQIVGTGPFYLDLEDSQRGSRFKWKKNAGYWDEAKPYLDGVDWLLVADESAAFAAFQTKQLDNLLDIRSGRTAKEIQGNNPDAVMAEYSPAGGWRLYVNNRKPPLDNQLVREAITLALDRDEFIKLIAEGRGYPTIDNNPIGQFSPEEMRAMVPYDVEKAKELLAEAGYANGVEIETTFPGKHYGETYVTALELVQSQLRKAGIDLKLVSIQKADWSKRRKKGDYVLGLQGGGTTIGDVDSWLYPAMHSGLKYNYNGVNDPELDKMLEAQRVEADPVKRRALLREIFELMDENTYAISIASRVVFEFWHPYVKNYFPHGWTTGLDVRSSWIDKG